MFLAIFITIFLMAAICVEILKRSKAQKLQEGKRYVEKIPGWPYIGIGFEFMGKSSQVTFRRAVQYAIDYKGRARANAGHHKWILVAVPEDIEVIATDQRFLEKSDEYNMLRDWLQDGLLTVGSLNKWRNRRKVITPAFHFKILDEFVHVMEQQADILVDIMRKHASHGGAFDVCDYLTLYTLDVMCETSMGVAIKAQTDKESDYVKAVKEITALLNWRQANFLARDDWFWKLTPQKRRHDRLVRKIHDFTISVIENRKAEKLKEDINQNSDSDFGIKRRAALLDVLLDSSINGTPLSNRDIQEEVDNFMFAGHDTTTSAIEFLLYNLARFPDIQQKVYQEIEQIFDSTGPVTLSQLNDLNYLDLVIKESLRLYPPVPFIARYLREEMEVNGNVYPANHNIILAIYALHRDSRYHKNPFDFVPERFTEQRSHDTVNAYSYIPFSAGNRNCIGQKFAQYEIKTVISRLLRAFEIRLEPGFELQYTYEIILRPTNGIRLQLIPRN